MATVAVFPQMQDLSFTCPKVLPKVYVTNGPSGWPETFVRKIVDAELERFVRSAAPTIDADELVEMFIATRELSQDPEPTSWFTIMGFIGRQLCVGPKTVPHTVGIAFWGRVVVTTTAKNTN